MPRHRDPLPEDIKEMMALCRTGRVFEIQKQIAAGARIFPPLGYYTTNPFKVAVETGIHSLIEVFLQAGIPQEEKDAAFHPVSENRLDLIELLAEYGADPSTVTSEDLLFCHNPMILRWFVRRGVDLETGYPLAKAFQYKNRQFLGIFMDHRDKLPTARAQAAMALRIHVRNGNEKWMGLMLWAGADPRETVLDLENPDEDWSHGSALSDAVRYGRNWFVNKVGLDPKRDNLSALLASCLIMEDVTIVQMLLEAGADPNEWIDDANPMSSLVRNFAWSLDRSYFHSTRSVEVSAACLELAAKHGGRWTPQKDSDYFRFRRHLTSSPAYEVVPLLYRLWVAGVFPPDVFKKLMGTKRMKSLILGGGSEAAQLRQAAGHKDLSVKRRSAFTRR